MAIEVQAEVMKMGESWGMERFVEVFSCRLSSCVGLGQGGCGGDVAGDGGLVEWVEYNGLSWEGKVGIWDVWIGLGFGKVGRINLGDVISSENVIVDRPLSHDSMVTGVWKKG